MVTSYSFEQKVHIHSEDNQILIEIEKILKTMIDESLEKIYGEKFFRQQ